MTLMGSWAVWNISNAEVAVIDLYKKRGDTRCDLNHVTAGKLCHPRSFTNFTVISWEDFKNKYNVTMDDLLKGAYH